MGLILGEATSQQALREVIDINVLQSSLLEYGVHITIPVAQRRRAIFSWARQLPLLLV